MRTTNGSRIHKAPFLRHMENGVFYFAIQEPSAGAGMKTNGPVTWQKRREKLMWEMHFF